MSMIITITNPIAATTSDTVNELRFRSRSHSVSPLPRVELVLLMLCARIVDIKIYQNKTYDL